MNLKRAVQQSDDTVLLVDGLTAQEAVAALAGNEAPPRSLQAAVTRLPDQGLLPEAPLWTAAALSTQRDDLCHRFPGRGVFLLPVPNTRPQRHLTEQSPVSATAALPQEAVSPSPDSGPKAPATLRPAISYGPASALPAGFPADLVEALQRAAEGTAGLTWIGSGGTRRHGYAEIHRSALSILGGLQKIPCEERQIVLVDMRDASLAVPAIFACLMGNLIPAPVMLPHPDGGAADLGRIGAAIDLLAPAAILSGDATLELRPGDPGLLPIRDLLSCEPGRTAATIDPDGTAVILLTSGSTGVPKGVHQSHAAMLRMVAHFAIGAHGLGRNDRVMNWMPLDHVGSLALPLFGSVTLGIPLVQVEPAWILQDPSRWAAIATAERSTITWFPNFAFRLLAEHAPAQGDLSALRRLISGGEVVQAADVELFLRRFEPLGLRREGSISPSFGMSETCSGISVSEGPRFKGPFACLGKPVANSALRIVDDQQNVLPEGRTGRLQVAGPQVLRRYHGQPDAPLTLDGWFDTGDLGFLDDGALYLTGRTKDLLNINGVKYFPQEIEASARLVPGIDPRSVIALPHAPEGAAESVAILFAPLVPAAVEDDFVVASLGEGIRRAVLARQRVPVRLCLPCSVEALPRTSIGKINRTALTLSLAAGDWDGVIRRMSLLDAAAPTRTIGLHRVVRRAVDHRAGPPMRDILQVTLGVGRRAAIHCPHPAAAAIAREAIDRADTASPGDAYARVLSLAQALADLPPHEAPAGVEVRLHGHATEAEALAVGLVRSLNLSGPRRWHILTGLAEGAGPEAAAGSALPHLHFTGEGVLGERIERVTPAAAGREGNGGFWIVAGGLGGIGSRIARHLDAAGNAVLCLGRTGKDQLPADRGKILHGLSRGRYLACDLQEAQSLQNAVAYGQDILGGPLAGIILAAGGGEPRSLAEETPESCAALAAPLLAGLRGAIAVAAAHPGATVTVVGSVVGLLGGRSHGYAAAHSALLSAAERAIDTGHPVSYVGFSSWEETGLSAGVTNAALLSRDGLQSIDPETGLFLIDAVRRRPGSLWVAGVDDMHPAHVAMSTEPCHPLVAAVAVIEGLEWPGAMEVRDALGRRSLVAVRPLPADGADPLGAWAPADEGRAGRQPPVGPVERVVARQFAAALGLDTVLRDEDFFRLGGSSLTAGSVASRLSRLFFADLTMNVVFRHPTPRTLAAALIAAEQEPGLTEAAAEQIEALLACETEGGAA